MFDFLKKLFGTKSEKDIKDLESKVEEINNIYASLKSVSNDELRARSQNLKSTIHASVNPQNEKIKAIKDRFEHEPEMDVDTKESLYKEIDDVEKEIAEEFEK